MSRVSTSSCSQPQKTWKWCQPAGATWTGAIDMCWTFQTEMFTTFLQLMGCRPFIHTIQPKLSHPRWVCTAHSVASSQFFRLWHRVNRRGKKATFNPRAGSWNTRVDYVTVWVQNNWLLRNCCSIRKNVQAGQDGGWITPQLSWSSQFKEEKPCTKTVNWRKRGHWI